MNYLNNLPDDMIWEIYRRLHKSYMKDMLFKDEIYEAALDMQYKLNNNLGDDLDEWETTDTSDTEETDSVFSYDTDDITNFLED